MAGAGTAVPQRRGGNGEQNDAARRRCEHDAGCQFPGGERTASRTWVARVDVAVDVPVGRHCGGSRAENRKRDPHELMQ